MWSSMKMPLIYIYSKIAMRKDDVKEFVGASNGNTRCRSAEISSSEIILCQAFNENECSFFKF